MSDRFPSDPEKFSGIWFTIHVMSKRCRTEKDENEFISFMTMISETLPCEECRKHCKKFMLSHKLENYKGFVDYMNNRVGMFKWSWMLHNSINIRLGKSLVDMKVAYNFYDSEISSCKKCEI